MLGCAPGTAGAHSIRLGGPVTVMSRSRASTAAGEARSLTAGDGRTFAMAAATSRADTGPATPAGRASCRGASSGFARASACLSLPVSLGKSGNAIAARLNPSPGNTRVIIARSPWRNKERPASRLRDGRLLVLSRYRLSAGLRSLPSGSSLCLPDPAHLVRGIRACRVDARQPTRKKSASGLRRSAKQPLPPMAGRCLRCARDFLQRIPS